VPEPSYQKSVQTTGVRTTPDVSLNADPNTGYAVYTTIPSTGQGLWLQVGGTSASTQAWAGIIAIIDQGRVLSGQAPLDGATQTLPALYALSSSNFHDIVSGGNGYAATRGYDLATGLGSPVLNVLIPSLVGSTATATTGSGTGTTGSGTGSGTTTTGGGSGGHHHGGFSGFGGFGGFPFAVTVGNPSTNSVMPTPSTSIPVPFTPLSPVIPWATAPSSGSSSSSGSSTSTTPVEPPQALPAAPAAPMGLAPSPQELNATDLYDFILELLFSQLFAE
jgi:subtilase family serine protease